MPGESTITVLIAGCGDLGTETGLLLAARGHRVIGVRRSADVLPAAFARQSIDLTHDAPHVPADVDVVIVALAATERTAEAYRAVYVDGLRHVLEGAASARATPRLLLVSSTAVYGVDDGSWVDERTPTDPNTPTAKVLREAETIVERYEGESSILRLGGVYGPGRTRLIDQVRAGDCRVPRGSHMTNRIHRDDAARALVHLALLRSAPPPVLIGVDDEPAQLGDVLGFLARSLDVREPPSGRNQGAGAGRKPTGDRRLANDLLRSTGFRFRYPSYREGYAAVLAGEGIRHP
ncbi:NAD-dependent epimerase/dehydratase family protein [Frondihabitans australicus]|uniref:Nucleoside-diphosphate-sugar epimerase n=1 Tax=Frondihabitans australicus TaxID=386892 RepID=A0A495IFY7_9MICO|nr:NAD-dependent epimerase/dehydratase family protein [Frondihabitans australicus]RKR74932.1 nucleoside-diphosphate-sugar epimerase [Frondihabitans australicus]